MQLATPHCPNTLVNELISKHSKMIKDIAAYYAKRFRLPYGEVYQAVLISIWKNYDKFDKKDKLSLKGFISKSTFWILHREYFILKKDSKKTVDFSVLNEEGVDFPKSVNIDTVEFYDCLNSIPEKYQKILKMYYLDRKNLSEIGKEIGVCSVAVMKYRNIGLKLFLKKWGGKCQNKKLSNI